MNKERGMRYAHVSGEVAVGQSESKGIWLKRTKEQLMEGRVMDFLYPFSIWVLKQPRKKA